MSKTPIPPSISADSYIAELFQDDEHLAVLAVPRGGEKRDPEQRILTAERARADGFQRWLRHLNANGHDIFVGMNPLRPDRKRREKRDVAAIRRLQLDLDERGPESLRRVLNDVRAGQLPQPAALVRSSRNRYQVIWHTTPGWTAAEAEDAMSRLAQRYGGDPAVADVARVMRLPGFRNKKEGRDDALASWTDYGGRAVDQADFGALPERRPAPSAARPRAPAPGPKPISQSERDWAYVRDKLRRGEDPAVLVAHLERTRQDKHDPAYYAERTVRRAVASLEERVPSR